MIPVNFYDKRVWLPLGIILVLVIISVFIPINNSFLAYMLRGLVVFGIVWILIIYQYSIRSKNQVNVDQNDVSRISKQANSHQIFELREEYNQLLGKIFKLVKSVNPEYITAIYMIDPEGGYTLQKSTDSIFKDFIKDKHAKLLKKVLKSKEGRTFHHKDYRNDWGNIFNIEIWRGSECMLGAPIIYNDSAIGCVMVQIDHFSKVQENDPLLLANLGDFISLGMEKIERIEGLLEDKYNHSKISSLFDILNISSSEDDLLELIKGLARGLFVYDKFTISKFEPSINQAQIKLVDGYDKDIDKDEYYEIHSSLYGLIIRENETIRTSNWRREYNIPERTSVSRQDQQQFTAILGTPVRVKGEIWGSIILETFEEHHYTKTSQDLLEILASTFSSIYSWINEYQSMHVSATMDALTGLFNRRAFMQRLEEEISRATRFQQELVLIILDLDKFKRINDTLGHTYGDYVIAEVAKIIKNSVRNIDVVGRYGGEEYAVAVVSSSKHESEAIARRIVSNIENYNFVKDGSSVKMTISAGLADFAKDVDQIKDLIDKADQAMYEVKEAGGNSVAVFSPK